jgi:serpin B
MKKLASFLILILASSCTFKKSPSQSLATQAPRQSPTPPFSPLSLTPNELTFQLYQLRSEEPSNVIFSPLSLKLAFELLYPGATGENPKILESAFGLNSKTHLSQSEGASAPEVKIANGIWMKDPKSALPTFKDAIKELGSEIRPLSVSSINDFVDSATQGKIEKMINSLDPQTALIAINALYFKGEWGSPFYSELTRAHHFSSSPYKTVVTEMMHQLGKFPYAEDEDSKWIDLPYKGSSMVMTLVLPKKRFELKVVHQKLTASKFQAALSKMKTEKVSLSFPKFRIQKKESMKELLISAGYGKLFDSTGWKKLSTHPLTLADSIQALSIQVDEQGTEAAAVTKMEMRETAMLELNLKEFECDQPFIFILRNKKSGEIHFIGKLFEPEIIKK